MNIGIQISIQVPPFNSFGYIPRSGIFINVTLENIICNSIKNQAPMKKSNRNVQVYYKETCREN